MPPIWKCKQFEQESGGPFGVAGKVDVSRFNLGGLRHHPLDFAPVRLSSQRPYHSARQVPPEVLQQCHAGARVLDQDSAGLMLRRQAGNLAPKVGVLEARAEHVDEVVVPFDDLPGGADRIVVGLARHRGDVPTLDAAHGGALGQLVIVAEPVAPNEIALERDGPLLVLSRELQAADLRLDPVQRLLALALRVQEVADPSDLLPVAAERE